MHRTLSKPDAPPQPFLIFRISSYELALPHTAIRQIVPHPDTVGVSNQCSWLRGLLRGGLLAIPVIDTAILLGVESEAEEPTVVVVSNPDEQAAFRSIGLLVDRVADTARVPAKDWKPLRPSSALSFRGQVEASWRGRSRPCYLLHLPALIPADLEAQFSPCSIVS